MTGELYDNCRTWPTAGRTPRATTLGRGAAPILVIGNERDPATPIGGTKQLAKDLASGVLLTRDHDGHGTYFAGSSCVDSAVDGYLIQGHGAHRRHDLLSRVRSRPAHRGRDRDGARGALRSRHRAPASCR